MTLNQLDNYYLQLPEPEQSCLLYLRRFILDYSDDLKESFKFNCPFFLYKGKMFCYFSISKKTQKTYVGFINGKKIKHAKLLSEGRSQIKVLYIDPNKDIDLKSLKQILLLATK